MAYFETERANSRLRLALNTSEVSSFSENRDHTCIIRMKDGQFFMVVSTYDEIRRVVGLQTLGEMSAKASSYNYTPAVDDEIPF